MKKNYNDISHIEAWLRGELNEADRQAFEAQLVADETLRKEVEAYRKIFNGFQAVKDEAFANDVARWIQEAKTGGGEKSNIVPIKRGATMRTLWRRVAVAAGIVLLLGAAVVWWGTQRYSDEKLLSAAYAPPISSATMGPKNNVASNLITSFENAHATFQAGNYEEAAWNFRVVIKGIENNPDAFDGLTRKFYLENSRWTLLLAEFASGQLPEDNFIQVLDAIASDPSSEYAKKAKELKADVGSFWRKLSL